MRISYFLLLCIASGEKIIRNMNIKSCKNCIYFKPSFSTSPSRLGKCEKFETKDIITSEVIYEFTDLCRRDEDKCGESGKYFEEENKAIKMFKFNIIKYNIFFHSPYGFIMLVTFANALLNVSSK